MFIYQYKYINFYLYIEKHFTLGIFRPKACPKNTQMILKNT
tara:strand:+ start:3749 stop:3871 length:123 start_codon:yes stop_codon:yes gene_type:complete